MSSGAKRLVQSLRGRTSGGGGGGRSSGGGSSRFDGTAGEGNVGTGVGSGAPTTSVTRLCHYDSGHELDEISVVGGTTAGNLTGLHTPTTPCHCTALKYDSRQTLYSIAGLPPAPAAPLQHATTPHRAHYEGKRIE